MSTNPLRISFEEAIGEERLLRPWFEELSIAQRAILKILYGCELDTVIKDDRGFTELDHWSLMHESGEFDDLGYPTKVHPIPYRPKIYREAFIVAGIRAGKSDRVAATITVYEAVCGGHEAFLRKGRKAVCFQVAQDLRFARYSLHGIRAILQSMAFIEQPWGKSDSRIVNVTADQVELWNGMIIATCPPTVKSIRGYDAPVGVMDEVGVWYADSDAANPDFEIHRALVSRQAQFADPIIVGISSPWSKHGMLYDRYQAGTDGEKLRCQTCQTRPRPGCPACRALRLPHEGHLVLYGTSASLGNPMVRRDWLEDQRDKDPKAFARECLARFQDSLSGFLDAALLREAIERGVVEHPPDPSRTYVAAFDPAFRRDAFGFAIGHGEGTKVAIDLVRKWQPRPGEPPLNPDTLFATEIVPLLRAYRVVLVYSDQHHFDSLNQLALQHGFALECVPFSAQSKADIYGNLKQLVNARRLRVVDHPETVRQLQSLEAKLTDAGGVQIGAPKGQYDDLATVAALVAHKAIWLVPGVRKPEPPRKTGHDEAFAWVQAKRRLVVAEEGGWD